MANVPTSSPNPASAGSAVPASTGAAPAALLSTAVKARVLLSDDSRIVRAAASLLLRDHFEIREVADGEAAWQAILLDASIRVMVTGLGLQKIDGYELLSRLRSSKVQRIRDLPIIAMIGDDDQTERERALSHGATDVVRRSAVAGELLSRLEVLVKLSTTREALIESQATLESARTVDPDTELLNMQFFDKQVEKLVSYSRRSLTDVELSMPQTETWEGEVEQRIKLVGRALAASIRLEDLGTRTDRFEFCVATQSGGLSSVLRFAARLRKVLENVEAAGPGVEVWTCIGVATLSEELRRGAEELRLLSQKRAMQAQTTRSRRIILGASDGVAPGALESRPEDGSMDINLALALIRAGRPSEVIAHLARLLDQLSPLLKLVRQQHELQSQNAKTETERNETVSRVPRPVDPRS
jgi:CheY-like chemotaxis protein